MPRGMYTVKNTMAARDRTHGSRCLLLACCFAGLVLAAGADHSLLDSNRTALVVVDVQADFLAKLPLATRNAMVDRIAWMMRVATALGMPIVATAEDYESGHNPSLLPKLAALLPPNATVHNKMVWNAYGQPDIRAALDATGRSAFVVVGLETDVCVAQTALGLQAAGFRVAVVEDACGSAPPHHGRGIRRLRDAGVTVTDAKAAYYELTRDIPTEAAVYNKTQAMPGGTDKVCERDQTY